MLEKESIMVIRCQLKITWLGITLRHHSASLVMPNSYPRDGMFNPHLTIIKYSYILVLWDQWAHSRLFQIWAPSWQNQQCGCAPSEDSDQPGHPPSLIRVFAVRMKKGWVLCCPMSAKRRLWTVILLVLSWGGPYKIPLKGLLEDVSPFAFTLFCRVDYPILINWTSLFQILGASGVLFHFYIIFIEIHVDPDQTPRSGSTLFA